MINTNTNVLGIIFPNVYDELVSELTRLRSRLQAVTE